MQVIRQQHDGLHPPRSLLLGPLDRDAQKLPRTRAPEQASPLIRHQRKEEHASFVVATIMRHSVTVNYALKRVQRVARPTAAPAIRQPTRVRLARSRVNPHEAAGVVAVDLLRDVARQVERLKELMQILPVIVAGKQQPIGKARHELSSVVAIALHGL